MQAQKNNPGKCKSCEPGWKIHLIRRVIRSQVEQSLMLATITLLVERRLH